MKAFFIPTNKQICFSGNQWMPLGHFGGSFQEIRHNTITQQHQAVLRFSESLPGLIPFLPSLSLHSLMVVGEIVLTTFDAHTILKFRNNQVEMIHYYYGVENLIAVFPTIRDLFVRAGISMLYGGAEGFVQLDDLDMATPPAAVLPNPPNSIPSSAGVPSYP